MIKQQRAQIWSSCAGRSGGWPHLASAKVMDVAVSYEDLLKEQQARRG